MGDSIAAVLAPLGQPNDMAICGAAVQNMNLMLGLEETTGLTL